MKKVTILILLLLVVMVIPVMAQVHDSNSASRSLWGLCISIGQAIIDAEVWVLTKAGLMH